MFCARERQNFCMYRMAELSPRSAGENGVASDKEEQGRFQVWPEDQYPEARRKAVFTSLAGGRHFSEMDQALVYLQMAIEDKYCTGNSHKDLFQYNWLLFGTASTHAVWKRATDQP